MGLSTWVPFAELVGPSTQQLNTWRPGRRQRNFPTWTVSEYLGGEESDRIEASILNFLLRVQELAATIPVRNHGPFLIVHNDFGHNNIVVDDNWNMLGVIDWDTLGLFLGK